MAFNRKYIEDIGVHPIGGMNQFVGRFVAPQNSYSEVIKPNSPEDIIGKNVLAHMDISSLNTDAISEYTHISTLSSFGEYSNKTLGYLENLRQLQNDTQIAHTFLDIETLGERSSLLSPGEKNFFAITEIGLTDSLTKKTGVKFVSSQLKNSKQINLVGWVGDEQLQNYKDFIDRLKMVKNSGASVVYLSKNERLLAENLLKYSNKDSFRIDEKTGLRVHNRVSDVNHISGANILTKLDQMENAVINLTENRNKPEAIIKTVFSHIDNITNRVGQGKSINMHALGGSNLFGFDLPVIFDFLDQYKDVSGAQDLRKVLQGYIKENRVFDLYMTHRTIYGEGSSGAAGAIKIARKRNIPNKEIHIRRYANLNQGFLKQENLTILYGLDKYLHSAAEDANTTKQIFGFSINDYFQNYISKRDSEEVLARKYSFGYVKNRDGIKGGNKFIASSGTYKDPLFKVFNEVDGKLVPADNSLYPQSGFLKNMPYEYLGYKHISHRDLVLSGVDANIEKYKYGIVTAVFKNTAEGTISMMAVPENSMGTGLDLILGQMQTKLVPDSGLITERGNLAISGFSDRAMRIYDKIYDHKGYEKVNRWLSITDDLSYELERIYERAFDPEDMSDEIRRLYNKYNQEHPGVFKNYTEFRNVLFASPRISEEKELFNEFNKELERRFPISKNTYGQSSLGALQDILEGKFAVPGVEGQQFGGRMSVAPTEFSDIKNVGGKSVNIATFKDIMKAVSRSSDEQIEYMLNSLADLGIISRDSADKTIRKKGKADFRFRASEAISRGIYKADKDTLEKLNAEIRIADSAKGAYSVSNKDVRSKIINAAIDEGIRRTPTLFKAEPLQERIEFTQNIINQQFRNAVLKRVDGGPNIIKPANVNQMISDFISRFTFGNKLMFDIIPDLNTSTLTALIYDPKKNMPRTANELRNSPNVVKISMPFLRDDFTFRIGREASINTPYLTVDSNGTLKLTSGIQMYYETMSKEAKKISDLILSGHEDGVVQAQKIVNRVRQTITEKMSGADRFDTEIVFDTYAVKTAPRLVNQMRAGFIDVEEAIPAILKSIKTDRQSIFAQKLAPSKIDNLMKAYSFFEENQRFRSQDAIAIQEAMVLGGWGDILGISGDIGSAKESITMQRLGLSMFNIREYVPFGFMSSTSNPRYSAGIGVHSLDYGKLEQYMDKGLVSHLMDPLVLTEGQLANLRNNEAYYLNLKVAQLDDQQIAQLFMDEGITGKRSGRALPSTTEGMVLVRKDILDLMQIRDIKEYIVNEVDSNIAKGMVLNGGRTQVTIGKEYVRAIQDGDPTEIAMVKRTSYWNMLEEGIVKDIEETGDGRFRVLVERKIKAKDGSKFKDESGGRYTIHAIDSEIFEKAGLEDFHMISNARTPVLKHRAFGAELASALRIVTDQIHNLYADATVGTQIVDDIKNDVMNTVKKYFDVSIRWSEDSRTPKGIFVLGGTTGLTDFNKVDIAAFYRELSQIGGGKIWNKDITQVTLADGTVARTGFERVGVQFEEDWYRRAGLLSKEGRVKMGQRHLEMLEMQGLHVTKNYFKEMIEEQAWRQDPSIGIKKPGEAARYNVNLAKGTKAQALGKIGQYVTAINKVQGVVEDITDDVFIRVNDIATGANQVELNKFARVQQYLPGRPMTRKQFEGTFFDLKGFAKQSEENNLIAKKILERGGAWLELPVTMDINEKAVDKIWLMQSNIASVKGTTEVYPDAIGAKVSRILRVVQEMQDYNSGIISVTLGQEITNRVEMTADEVATGYFNRRMTSAITEYQEELGKSFGKDGAVDKVLNTRLAGSGHFKVQTFNIMQPGVEEGAMYISESGFKEMIGDWFNPKQNPILKQIEDPDEWRAAASSLKEAYNIQLQKVKTEGVYMLGGREPVFHKDALAPVKVIVNDELVGRESNRVMLTLGTALKFVADSDGDNMFLHGGFFRDLYTYDKTERKFVLGGKGKTVYDEIASNWTQAAQTRAALAQEVMDDFNSKWKIGTEATYESLVEFGQRRGVEIMVRGQTPQTELEGLYARYGRRLIGNISNLHTGMRRMALTAASINNIAFDIADVQNVANFMTQLEQKGISSKLTSLDTWVNKKFGNVAGELTQSQIDEVVSEVINMGNATSDILTAIKKNDVKTIRDLSLSLGIYDTDQIAQLNRDLRSVEKLNTVMRGYLNSPEFKIGSGQQTIEKVYDMLFDYNTLSTEDLRKIEELAGPLTDRERGNAILNFISSRLQETDRYNVDGRLALEGSSETAYSVGKATLDGMQDSINPQKLLKYSAIGGAIFAGMNIIGGALNRPKGVDIPSEEPLGTETGYITTPQPALGSPTAYVTQDGYTNRRLTVSARNDSGLVTFDIANMVTNAVGGGINNMNVNISDNSSRLDWMWTQEVIKNSMSKGYAY